MHELRAEDILEKQICFDNQGLKLVRSMIVVLKSD